MYANLTLLEVEADRKAVKKALKQSAEKLGVGERLGNNQILMRLALNGKCADYGSLESMLSAPAPQKPFSANC